MASDKWAALGLSAAATFFSLYLWRESTRTSLSTEIEKNPSFPSKEREKKRRGRGVRAAGREEKPIPNLVFISVAEGEREGGKEGEGEKEDEKEERERVEVKAKEEGSGRKEGEKEKEKEYGRRFEFTLTEMSADTFHTVFSLTAVVDMRWGGERVLI